MREKMIASNGKTEIIVDEDLFSIERLAVPGGWLYITRYRDFGAQGPSSCAVATTFVAEEKDSGDEAPPPYDPNQDIPF